MANRPGRIVSLILRESAAWVVFFCTSPLWLPFVVSTLLRYRVRKTRPDLVMRRARRMLKHRRATTSERPARRPSARRP